MLIDILGGSFGGQQAGPGTPVKFKVCYDDSRSSGGKRRFFFISLCMEVIRHRQR